LKHSFIKETKFPRKERKACSIEDEIIHLFPNLPGVQDENLHENFAVEILPGFLHHALKLLTKPSIDI
jgi:hypothetical protein